MSCFPFLQGVKLMRPTVWQRRQSFHSHVYMYRIVLMVLKTCICEHCFDAYFIFLHTKIWYNCLKCLKMYLMRALFPKPTLLVTARGGTVFWSCLIFFFPNAENSHESDKKTNTFSSHHLPCTKLSPSYCTVWNEVTSSGKCPSHDSEYFQNRIWFTIWFFLFLQLWHASSLSTQQGSQTE